jgi:hypothetical protein
MIKLVQSDGDDPGFLSMIEPIINGALAVLGTRELFIVETDSWFDFKWLGFWSWTGKDLKVPPFTPRRVRTQKHFTRDDTTTSCWQYEGPGKALHLEQPGRSYLASPLSRFSASAAFVWYSGNTETNGAGSLMVYLAGADRYSWYASFHLAREWKIKRVCRIERRELMSFLERGRHIELNEAGAASIESCSSGKQEPSR